MDEKTKEGIKLTLFDWVGRAAFSLVVFFAYNIYKDVKSLTTSLPVLQERILDIENRVDKLENKVFPDGTFHYWPAPGSMKKEDTIAMEREKK